MKPLNELKKGLNFILFLIDDFDTGLVCNYCLGVIKNLRILSNVGEIFSGWWNFLALFQWLLSVTLTGEQFDSSSLWNIVPIV